jgi:hypothetical protein
MLVRSCSLLLAAMIAGSGGPGLCARQAPKFPRAGSAAATRKGENASRHPFSVVTLETVLSAFAASEVPHPAGPRGRLHLDTRRMAYGDLNGDGKRDAVVILDDAMGAPAWLVPVLNQDGEPSPKDPHVVGYRTVIHSMGIRSGRVLLRITPAGTTQQQQVEFTFAGKDYQGRPGLLLSLPAEPEGQNPATWLSYQSARYGFSFKYSRDYLLEEMDADVFLEGNRHQALFDFSILPARNFVPDAVRRATIYCDADGPDGGTYCNESDVERAPISIGTRAGYRMYVHLRDENSHRLTGDRLGPIYYCSIAPSWMLEIYGGSSKLLAILRTLLVRRGER